jgi:hypothetical protein
VIPTPASTVTGTAFARDRAAAVERATASSV